MEFHIMNDESIVNAYAMGHLPKWTQNLVSDEMDRVEFHHRLKSQVAVRRNFYTWLPLRKLWAGFLAWGSIVGLLVYLVLCACHYWTISEWVVAAISFVVVLCVNYDRRVSAEKPPKAKEWEEFTSALERLLAEVIGPDWWTKLESGDSAVYDLQNLQGKVDATLLDLAISVRQAKGSVAQTLGVMFIEIRRIALKFQLVPLETNFVARAEELCCESAAL
ncbi:MAG: hypothetical protein AAB511_04375 [Patescibacteria group bacterium]